MLNSFCERKWASLKMGVRPTPFARDRGLHTSLPNSPIEKGDEFRLTPIPVLEKQKMPVRALRHP